VRSGQFDIMDIPVYRLKEHRYTAQMHAFIDKVMTDHPLPTTPASPSTSDNLSSTDVAMRDHLFESYGGAWRYNEIIGYLRLYFLGTRLELSTGVSIASASFALEKRHSSFGLGR